MPSPKPTSLAWLSAVAACGVLIACGRPMAPPAEPSAAAADPVAWAYPGKQPPPRAWDTTRRVGLAGSSATYTEAELHDLFRAVDWRPGDHPRAPEIVLQGHRPDAMACGYCHLPDGQGRPENVPLAGLPAAYISTQVAAFRAGERRAAHADWVPSSLMARVARGATPAEVDAAAAYFARLPYASTVRLVETPDIPRVEPFAYLHRPLPGAEREPLGTRIIEMPDDPSRWERRDSRVRYVAYVPLGALARGQALASGETGRAPACASCHGEGLRGGPAAPPIAGRTPGYLFRQLYAFKTGARHAAADAPMRPVAAGLTTAEMVDAAAYAASLKP